jgi:hypothetical protein
MAQDHVNNAIRVCLVQCRSATDPVAQLAAFVSELRSARWNENDVRAVDVFVTQMLGALARTGAGGPKDDGAFKG